ncbi:hypothetical protein JXA32_14480 [Candidatus Sumerlaeota bacterium]|nr:hypothetical protein [Candidatus Sumerlaeota bacterium]
MNSSNHTATPDFDLPTRATLEQWSPEHFHKAQSMVQCDVLALEKDGHRLILKDASRRWWIYRVLFTRRILRREHRFLRLLDGLEGVPRAYGWIDADGFVMERLDARDMPGHRYTKQFPGEFFEQLAILVDAMHQRGVVHGDIRRKNIMMDEDGKPYLIDFATAWHRDTLLGAFMYKRLTAIDRLKVTRLKARHRPDLLTDEEQRQVENLPFLLRAAHWFKKSIYRHIKQRRWEERLGIRKRKSNRRQ